LKNLIIKVMSRISGKLNLLQLHGVVKMIQGQLGLVECLVLPLAKNKLFKGEKGIYLDIIAFEIDPSKRNEDRKDTHIIKQSFSKEIRESMTEDQLREIPILGSLQIWSGYEEQEPLSSPKTLDELSDLPF